MTKPLPHAEIIKHMADHGYESVQWGDAMNNGQLNQWWPGSEATNPINCPTYEWRIKPDTITVEIPRLEILWAGTNDADLVVRFQNQDLRGIALTNIKKAMGL